MKTRSIALSVLAGLLVGMGAAQAKLPPPTPEQARAADERKAKEAEAAKVQAAALERVQDSLAARFGKGPSAGAGAETSPQKVPQKAVEAPGKAGPQGGTSPSAEAHSGEAQRR